MSKEAVGVLADPPHLAVGMLVFNVPYTAGYYAWAYAMGN